MARNRLEETIKETRAQAFHAGNYSDLLIGNKVASYSIPYIHLRNRVYFAQHDTVMFQGDGYNFAIEGENMRLLLRMINLHQLAEIVEGERYDCEGQDVIINAITVEPLEAEESKIDLASRGGL